MRTHPYILARLFTMVTTFYGLKGYTPPNFEKKYQTQIQPEINEQEQNSSGGGSGARGFKQNYKSKERFSARR